MTNRTLASHRLSTLAVFVAMAGSATVWFGPTALNEAPQLLALSASFLLTIEIPLLVWAFVLWPRGTSVAALPSLAMAGLVLARGALPGFLQADPFLSSVTPLIVSGQLAVGSRALVSGWRAARSSTDRDLLDRCLAIAREAWGDGVIARALMYEGAAIGYAMGFGRGREAHRLDLDPYLDDGTHRSFTQHKQSGIVPLLVGLLFVGVLELWVVHLVVTRINPTLAWILFGIEAYGLLWFVGLIRSLPARPTEVLNHRVHIRYGILYDLAFDANDIESISMQPGAGDHEELHQKLHLFGSSNLVLHFRRSVEIRRPYGLSRSVRSVGLEMDEPRQFLRALEADRPG